MERDGTVVVVDDEPEILDIICDVLDEDGFHVVCAENPARFMEIESEVDACLYLLDLMLPGMDGIQLAKLLRSHQTGKVPMIAMSASSDMLSRARDSGLFDDYLPKPFDLMELLDRVEGYATG